MVLLGALTFRMDFRGLLVVLFFLPFPWFVAHFIGWLKLRTELNEMSILHGDLVALERERQFHRSQIIASSGALYFLIILATWVFSNAL